MSSPLAITPRNLGAIRLDGYCPHCLWYLLRMRFHPPFNHFGAAVFGDMQRIQEAVIGHYLDEDRRLPVEFDPFCSCIARVDFPNHYSKFAYDHSSGVRLYGAPDEILRFKDGTICVVDHKTAHNKGDDDPFHAQYECQVVGYANIAEVGLDLGKVSKGGLFYWEIQVDKVQDRPADFYRGKTVHVPVVPSVVEIEIDYAILDPLLSEVKKVWDANCPPDGRDGCRDCKKLAFLFGLEQEIEARDRKILDRFGDIKRVQRDVLHRDYLRRSRRLDALRELTNEGGFSETGIVSGWEFIGE